MCAEGKVGHAICDGIKYCTVRRNLGTIGCVIVAAHELTRGYRLAIKFRGRKATRLFNLTSKRVISNENRKSRVLPQAENCPRASLIRDTVCVSDFEGCRIPLPLQFDRSNRIEVRRFQG